MRRVAAEHSVAPDEAAQRSYASRSSLLAASQVSAGVMPGTEINVRIVRLLPLGAACVALYVVLAFGASVYGSYRYEPSGIQYLFLPVLAAPAALLLAVVIAVAARRRGAPRMLAILPFVAVVVLALPAIGLPLTNVNLEAARWAIISIGAGHVLVLLTFVVRQAHLGAGSPPA